MQWFEIESETAGGKAVRDTCRAASMVAAIKEIERRYPGWTVLQATEVEPMLERAKQLVRKQPNMFTSRNPKIVTVDDISYVDCSPPHWLKTP